MTMQENNSPSITYRKYKFASDFPFLLMQGTHIRSQTDFVHFHNCVEIALLEKGTMTWNLENKRYTLTPGNICFLPPFFTHASFFPPQENEDVLCHYIFFNPEQLLAPLHPNGFSEEFFWYRYTEFSKILPGDAFHEEKLLLENIIREFTEKKEHYKEAVVGLMEDLMVQLYRRHQSNPLSPARNNSMSLLFPVVSYIDREYQAAIEETFLAQLCGLSKTQFLNKFRESFHQTPKQYIRNVRIRKACNLLISTEKSVLDIAMQTGFSSLSSFNRSFLTIMRRTPLSFRNEHRAIIKKDLKYAPYEAQQ